MRPHRLALQQCPRSMQPACLCSHPLHAALCVCRTLLAYSKADNCFRHYDSAGGVSNRQADGLVRAIVSALRQGKLVSEGHRSMA